MSEKSTPQNEVYVGKKPVMSYVLAAMLMFNAGAKEVVIKARGRAISTAVSVAEILRKRAMPEKVELKEIKIDSETVAETGKNVSVMEIILAKKG